MTKDQENIREEEIMRILRGEAEFPEEISDENKGKNGKGAYDGFCIYAPIGNCIGNHQDKDDCPRDSNDCKFYMID